jgi:co-chaperonin GroES (HSP10)
MQPIGKFLVIKIVEEELKTQSGMILSAEDVNQFRYKRAIVMASGT